eukprot:PhM_4_TR381/c0_g1_i1/m.106826
MSRLSTPTGSTGFPPHTSPFPHPQQQQQLAAASAAAAAAASGGRQIVIYIKVKRLEVVSQDDDALTTPFQYAVTIDQDRLHILEASYREPVVDRDPETDATTFRVDWTRPRDTPVAVHATVGPDGMIISPPVLHFKVVQFNLTLQTFRDIAAKPLVFHKFRVVTQNGRIKISADTVLYIEVSMNYYRDTDSPKSVCSLSSIVDQQYVLPSPQPSPRSTPLHMLGASGPTTPMGAMPRGAYFPTTNNNHNNNYNNNNNLISSSTSASGASSADREYMLRMMERLSDDNTKLRDELAKERMSYNEFRAAMREQNKRYSELLHNHEAGGAAARSRCTCIIL